MGVFKIDCLRRYLRSKDFAEIPLNGISFPTGRLDLAHAVALKAFYYPKAGEASEYSASAGDVACICNLHATISSQLVIIMSKSSY